jgi:hypothetical protein
VKAGAAPGRSRRPGKLPSGMGRSQTPSPPGRGTTESTRIRFAKTTPARQGNQQRPARRAVAVHKPLRRLSARRGPFHQSFLPDSPVPGWLLREGAILATLAGGPGPDGLESDTGPTRQRLDRPDTHPKGQRVGPDAIHSPALRAGKPFTDRPTGSPKEVEEPEDTSRRFRRPPSASPTLCAQAGPAPSPTRSSPGPRDETPELFRIDPLPEPSGYNRESSHPVCDPDLIIRVWPPSGLHRAWRKLLIATAVAGAFVLCGIILYPMT